MKVKDLIEELTSELLVEINKIDENYNLVIEKNGNKCFLSVDFELKHAEKETKKDVKDIYKGVAFGYFSKQAYDCGHPTSYCKTKDGKIVLVTCICHPDWVKNYHWSDLEYVGEVTEWICKVKWELSISISITLRKLSIEIL